MSLILDEHFLGPSLNTSIWSTYDGPDYGAAGNDPADSYFCDGSSCPTNIIMNNPGVSLMFRRQKAPDGIGNYTGAGFETVPSYAITQGRCEVRARFPKNNLGIIGYILLWPQTPQWSNSNQDEIDFAELDGTNSEDPNYITFTQYYTNGNQLGADYTFQANNPITNWHVYAVEVDTAKNQVRWYIDGTLITTQPIVFRAGQTWIFGCGTWACKCTSPANYCGCPSNTVLPLSMDFDYVRVWNSLPITPIPPTTGTLNVSSSPEGAEIFIDSKDYGTVTISPYQPIINIPAGSHTLMLTLAGYQPYSITFPITAGQTTTLNPTLTPVPPTTGTLAVSSTPSGASVSVDGKSVGTTPASIPLAAGTHTLTLSLAGYQDYSRTFPITAGQTTNISTILNQVSGTIPTDLTLSPHHLRSAIRVGQSQDFTAEVLDQDSTPMANVQVQFIVSDNSVGTMNPQTATTDNNGIATSTFTAVARGTTTLQASVSMAGVQLTSHTVTINVSTRHRYGYS
jgi:hypothetical protein